MAVLRPVPVIWSAPILDNVGPFYFWPDGINNLEYWLHCGWCPGVAPRNDVLVRVVLAPLPVESPVGTGQFLQLRSHPSMMIDCLKVPYFPVGTYALIHVTKTQCRVTAITKSLPSHIGTLQTHTRNQQQ